MSVIELKSKAEFNELINKTPYVAIQAHATWCGPCKAISPFYTKHADALAIPDKYAFAKFDTDDVPDLAFELGVRSIPAFYFFKNGDKDESLIGPIPPKLKALVEGYAAEAKGEAGEAGEAGEEKPAEEKKEENALKTDENF